MGSLGAKKAIELLYSSDLTVDTYKNIHKVTCSHFNGDKTRTSEAGTPGNFRALGRSIREYLPVNSFGDTLEEREIMQNFFGGDIVAKEIADPANKFVSALEPGAVPEKIGKAWNTVFARNPNRDKAVEIIAKTLKTVDQLNEEAKNLTGRPFILILEMS